MQRQLQRIQRSARDMEQLIVLLLALAKDPARLAGISKPLALDALLPQIVEDHQHLTEGKSLQLHLEPTPRRSEEHTSELQSLMRISYAVFCLKKTTNTT